MSLYIPIVFSQIPILRAQGVSEFQILDVLRKVAIRYTPIIQRNTPVDTGRLRRSMRVELLLDNNGLAITSEVFYAGFVEFGTKKMSPRLFAQSQVPSIISEVLDGLQGLSASDLIRGGIRAFENDESGIYSGLTTQTLTDQLINTVVQNIVVPKAVGRLNVNPVTVESDRLVALEVLNELVA